MLTCVVYVLILQSHLLLAFSLCAPKSFGCCLDKGIRVYGGICFGPYFDVKLELLLMGFDHGLVGILFSCFGISWCFFGFDAIWVYSNLGLLGLAGCWLRLVPGQLLFSLNLGCILKRLHKWGCHAFDD
jgi:hypothetical protein